MQTNSHYEWQIPHKTSPHLILHFDMNKTLIATDQAGQKTAHDVICSAIAEQVMDTWDDSISTPISYAHYIKLHLLPNPDQSLDIKLKQKTHTAVVLQVLEKRDHPAYSKMQETYDRALQSLENQSTQVFPSFYKLIAYLQERNITYTLVIRTFGSEAPEIVKELSSRFGAHFDFYKIRQGELQENALYGLVTHANRHLVIQDDWKWWFEHGQKWEYGKPFPVDLGNPNQVSLFFDDNAGIDPLTPEENIVFPYDALTGKPIAPEQLIERERLFPVQVLEALCDEDYYVHMVEKALNNR